MPVPCAERALRITWTDGLCDRFTQSAVHAHRHPLGPPRPRSSRPVGRDATARAQLLLEVDGVELHGAVRLAISGSATCNVLETDTDYAERWANAGLDGPVQAFLLVQGRQGVGLPGDDRRRLRGGERPVPQTILQRAAGRRSRVQRRPRRGADPPRRFVR